MGVLQLLCSIVHEQIKGGLSLSVLSTKRFIYIASAGVVHSLVSCFLPLLNGFANESFYRQLCRHTVYPARCMLLP